MKKSNLKTSGIQQFTDGFWQKTLLPLIPNYITPNLVSLLRLCLIPIIMLFLFLNNYLIAIIIFILTALLDSLDGALARIRNQFSDWGLLIDPLSDKILIAGTLVVLYFSYPFKTLIIILVTLEILIITMSFFYSFSKNRNLKPSNIWGKIKMVLQTLAIILIILWLISDAPILLTLSGLVLASSIIFQLKSFSDYFYPRDCLVNSQG
jgi:CDP-diacylglycerol--glycerol-3-phosphate 3-phosphatidyltransferase